MHLPCVGPRMSKTEQLASNDEGEGLHTRREMQPEDDLLQQIKCECT